MHKFSYVSNKEHTIEDKLFFTVIWNVDLSVNNTGFKRNILEDITSIVERNVLYYRQAWWDLKIILYWKSTYFCYGLAIIFNQTQLHKIAKIH